MDGPWGMWELGFSRSGCRSISRFQVDRRSFPEQVYLVGLGPCDGKYIGSGLAHVGYGPLHLRDGVGLRAAGLRRRIPRRPCGSGNPPGRRVFPHNRVFVFVGGVLLSDGVPPPLVLPGPSRGREARGCRGPGPPVPVATPPLVRRALRLGQFDLLDVGPGRRPVLVGGNGVPDDRGLRLYQYGISELGRRTKGCCGSRSEGRGRGRPDMGLGGNRSQCQGCPGVLRGPGETPDRGMYHFRVSEEE